MLTPRNKERAFAKQNQNIIVNPKAFDEITQIACKVCHADYFRHDHNLYTVEQPTQLSHSTPNISRSIFPGQERANKTPLAPLARL